jgi:uncharacterized membrane protein
VKVRSTWLREAISDVDGMADAAYIVVLWVAIGVLCSIAFICIMSAISYFRCYTIADVGQGIRAQVPCVYDPWPTGSAIGAVCTAFAALLGALAGYMAATRRPPRDIGRPDKTVATATVTTTKESP